MKRFYLFIFICFIQLQASNILNFNIYESEDFLEIAIYLDAPFSGDILKKKNKNSTILTFSEIKLEENISKNLNSAVVQTLEIKQIDPNKLQMILKSTEEFILNITLSEDGFGLKVIPSIAPTQIFAKQLIKEETVQKIDSKNDLLLYAILSILVFIFLLLFFYYLFIIKKLNFKQKNIIKIDKDWLFGEIGSNPKIVLLFKKHLDSKNRLLLFQFENMRYLVLLGETSLLLEKFHKYEQKELKIFGEEDRVNMTVPSEKDKLDSYKNRASKEE